MCKVGKYEITRLQSEAYEAVSGRITDAALPTLAFQLALAFYSLDRLWLP